MELENSIKICSKDLLMSQAIEEPVDVDMTLPDYCPDIEKILKCTLTPQIFSRNISGGVLEIEGTAVIKVMYVDSVRKTLRTSQQLVPFNRTMNIKEFPESHYLETVASTEYINCRALSPRRLVIKGAFSIKVEIVAKSTAMLPSSDSFSDFQKRCCNKKYMDVTAVTEETFNINETISIQNKPDIESSVKTIVKVNVTDHKSVDDKIILKGEVNLRVLYLSDLDSGDTNCIDYMIPFSQIISCVGADRDTINNVSCRLLSYDVRSTKESDEKSIFIEARVNATAICYREREQNFLIDAYSKDYACDLNIKPISVITSVREIKRNFIRKMDISSNDRDFAKIIDVYNETSSVTSKEDNGLITFSGKAGLCILACDSEGIPFYIERTMDFADKTDEAFGMIESSCVTVNSVSYRIKDDHTLELRVEFTLVAFVTDTQQNSFVDNIVIYEDKKIDKGNSALTLYFADKGEYLWDIAKRYNTDENFIKEDNDIEDDFLPHKDMLIIRR
ncbi:MAG: DUF3794 domain-containing protein [Oscillospiraceae bacterium]|nr:DUF3794 domain-containing protein [Oscillospiraceae bacterium]